MSMRSAQSVRPVGCARGWRDAPRVAGGDGGRLSDGARAKGPWQGASCGARQRRSGPVAGWCCEVCMECSYTCMGACMRARVCVRVCMGMWGAGGCQVAVFWDLGVPGGPLIVWPGPGLRARALQLDVMWVGSYAC